MEPVDSMENEFVSDGWSSDFASADPAVQRLGKVIARCLSVLAMEGDPPKYLASWKPITTGEAEGFFRAVDGGLFELSDDGWGFCMPRRTRPTHGLCYPLLIWSSKADSEVRLWREWLTHAATSAVLHFDYGYPLHDIALDIDAFDVLVYSPLNQPLVAVEVKKNTKELDRMLTIMDALQREPFPPTRTDTRLSNSAKKFRGLLALRPEYFLAVAPEASHAFEVRYPSDRTSLMAELSPIERLPSARA
jgi:hypothetical protein